MKYLSHKQFFHLLQKKENSIYGYYVMNGFQKDSRIVFLRAKLKILADMTKVTEIDRKLGVEKAPKLRA